MEIKEYYILYTEDNKLKDNGSRLGTLEMLRADYPLGWLIIPTSDLPSDFSTDTYTIENGSLVRASDEVIAEREAAAVVLHNEQQRQKREAEYRAVTDPRVIEQIAESNPEIKALKDAIRDKYPYKS